MPVLLAVFMTLLVLKLAGVIALSWLMVFLWPVIGFAIVAFAILALAIAVSVLAAVVR